MAPMTSLTSRQLLAAARHWREERGSRPWVSNCSSQGTTAIGKGKGEGRERREGGGKR